MAGGCATSQSDARFEFLLKIYGLRVIENMIKRYLPCGWGVKTAGNINLRDRHGNDYIHRRRQDSKRLIDAYIL